MQRIMPNMTPHTIPASAPFENVWLLWLEVELVGSVVGKNARNVTVVMDAML